MTLTRRTVMKLAAFASSAAALAGAVRAEGGATASVTLLPFAQQTPMHVGAVALRVRDMGAMRRYYSDLLGFGTISENADEVVLGVDGVPLLHLLHRPDAPFESQSSAGLFHTAFLMPSREDLARWLVHAARTNVQFTGFADHNVSEASYLTDPEGNGIEVYSDRPPSAWIWDGETVKMGTEELDIDGILKLTDTSRDLYDAPPAGLRIGHMHLRVGAVDQGRGFYEGLIGMNSTRGDRPDSAFLSSGHYHHHIGINIWNSQGAGMRNLNETGLAWFSLLVTDKALMDDRKGRLIAAGITPAEITGGIEASDPWGTRLRLISIDA